MHAVGLLYRDIKPADILMCRRYLLPVPIDFGAANQEASRFNKAEVPCRERHTALEWVTATERLWPWTDTYGTIAVTGRMMAGGDQPLKMLGLAYERETRLVHQEGALESLIARCLRSPGTERTWGSWELVAFLRRASDQLPWEVSVDDWYALVDTEEACFASTA